MRSRLLLNLLLICCVAALAAFLYSTSGGPPIATITRITELDAANITQIKIERPAQEPIAFSRQEDRWLMSSPYQARAHDKRINAMLRLLTVQSHARLDANKTALGRFKLDSPQVTLSLNEHVFLFGDTEALDERRYVQFENTIHLVNDTLYPQLTTAATFFISPRLLPSNAELLSLQLPGHKLQLTDAQWSIDPPENTTPATLPDLIEAWQQASAITVSPYEETEAHGEIRIHLADGGQLLFRIVSEPPQLILARPDLAIQYHLDGYTAKQLFIAEKQIGDT